MMSWQDDLAAVRAEQDPVEHEAMQRAIDAQAAAASRLADLQPRLAELKRVHAALCRQKWPGAYRSPFRLGDGLVRRQVMAQMEIPEIIEKIHGESDFTMVKARIYYYKYPSSERVKVSVLAGHPSSLGHEQEGDIELRGSRWREVTPALIKRAAARYCVRHGVELALE